MKKPQRFMATIVWVTQDGVIATNSHKILIFDEPDKFLATQKAAASIKDHYSEALNDAKGVCINVIPWSKFKLQKHLRNLSNE